MDTKKLFLNIVTILLLLGFSFGLVGEFTPVNAAGGAYTIKFSSAQSQDYVPGIPYPELVYPYPVNRANGDDWIPNAYYTIPGGTKASVESINPYGMALCQVVPFEFEITVSGDTTPEDGVISITAGWSTETTSGKLFGYDETVNPIPQPDPPDPNKYGVIAAFIDIDDGSYTDLNEDAQVDFYNTTIIPNSGNGEIQGTFQVSGLDDGDQVVMEVWLVLDCELPDKVNGNVASRLMEAHTVYTPQETISTGNQTVPLLQVGEFESTSVYLSVYKVDDNQPKEIYPPDGMSDMWKNTIVVSAGPDNSTNDYVANEVTIVDTLDPWVHIVDTADYNETTNPYGIKITQKYLRACTYAPLSTSPYIRGGTLTCDLKAISEAADAVPVENIVTIEYWLRAIPGVSIGSTCEGSPGLPFPAPSGEIDSATSVASDCPITPLSPTGYDVMNRVDLTTISADQTPGDDWDEEPKDIVSPNAVEIEYFEATGQFKSGLLEWKTVTEMNNLGFNIYRSFRLNGPRVQINAELILADIFGQGGSEYAYLDIGLYPNRTYFYWLEDVDFDGTTTLYGPISGKPTRK
jgi:hypothetical protein